MGSRILPLLAVLLLGCAREAPFAFEQKNLGVRATFPGEPMQGTYAEETPFGPMEWHDYSYTPSGRLDVNFHLDVGNLPPGTQGGDTAPVALATFQTFLNRRLGGSVQRTGLPPERGAGFQYTAAGAGGTRVEGVVILRRGRLHHAQATVADAGDARVKRFLDSFAVLD